MGLILMESHPGDRVPPYPLRFWAPLALVVGGFAYLLIVAFATPFATTFATVVAIIAIWGLSWFVAYLVLFVSFRQVRPSPKTEPSTFQRVSGRRLGFASGFLLGLGFLLFALLVFVRSPPTHCSGGGPCLISNTVPWTFGLLTITQVFELDLAVISVGIVLLALASWGLASRQRSDGPFGGGHRAADSPSRTA